MANDVVTSEALSKPKKVSDVHSTSLTSKCSVCHQLFKSLQECLKHELLFHSLRKSNSTKKPVDSRLKVANKFLNSIEKRQERIKIHNALQKCERGDEFAGILKVLCLDSDCLELIFTRIETCITTELLSLGPVKIFPFGSIASGLALRDSDIDIYMDASDIPTHDFSQSPKNRKLMQPESPRMSQHRGSFNRINYALQRSPHFVEVYPIRRARVPIIKCKHSDTGFSIDINVCCRSSLDNTQFIRELVHSDPRIRELLLFLKLWAKNMQIIGKANMTSYCLITMVVFYLQQPYKPHSSKDRAVPILKSVSQLQRNCNPKFTEGINYGFDLQSPDNKPRVPHGLLTIELLKGFFQFYKEFNFDEFIVSPFLGRAIPKTDFAEDKFKIYRDQLANITHYMDGVPAPTFAVDRSMCVQDSFALNHNVAHSIIPPSKQYFMLCLENANHICRNLNKSTCDEILEKLLYETAPDAGDIMGAPQTLKTAENSDVNLNIARKGLNYYMEPSKADLNCIAKLQTHLTDPTALLREWCDNYVEAIPRLITDFYHIDFQTHIESPQKQQRLENNNLSHIWQISSSVDLWSNRFFQKSTTQSFYDYQMAQTQRLHSLRRQDATFCIQLKALLTISILSGYTGINVSVTLPNGSSELCKKDPLKKFFNALKNTLQNFSYKDVLDMEEKRISGEIMEKSVNEEKKNGRLGFG